MDAVTASLLKEAGGAPKAQNAAIINQDFNAAFPDQAGRDAQARRIVAAEGGVDPAAGVVRSQEEWSAKIGGQPAQPDPVTASLLSEAKQGDMRSIPDKVVPPVKAVEETAFQKYVKGPAEAALTVATAIPASIAGAAGGVLKGVTGGKYGTKEGGAEAAKRAAEITRSLTYIPRTESGRDILQTAGEVLDATKLQGLGPNEAITLGSLASSGPRAAVKAAPKAEAGQYGSAGAAGANVAEQAKAMASAASPELQAVVEKAASKLNPQSLRTLERHVDADTLPVRVSLTEGQATGNPRLISNERNNRAAQQGYVERFNEQNRQLIENTQAIKEKAAPDVYVSSKPELGDLIIQAYRDKDTALNAGVSAKYKALRDANGGQFPLDGVAFVDSADKALHKALMFDHVPPPLRSTMERLREGGKMTFEQFEHMRTQLARIQRSQADGNVKHAAGIVRESLENMPLTAEAAQLKPLADAARQAAKERFSMIETDPAYRAVVKGKAKADNFIQKYVLGADSKDVAKMKESLASDPVAQQAMASGAIRMLEDDAKIAGGTFTQAGYNRGLEKLRPKLSIMFEPEVSGDIERLGRVANYVQHQPAGAFVNNSNTWVSALGSMAGTAAEVSINRLAGAGSNWLPLGTIMREGAGRRAANKEMRKALGTGAGLTTKGEK